MVVAVVLEHVVSASHSQQNIFQSRTPAQLVKIRLCPSVSSKCYLYSACRFRIKFGGHCKSVLVASQFPDAQSSLHKSNICGTDTMQAALLNANFCQLQLTAAPDCLHLKTFAILPASDLGPKNHIRKGCAATVAKSAPCRHLQTLSIALCDR